MEEAELLLSQIVICVAYRRGREREEEPMGREMRTPPLTEQMCLDVEAGYCVGNNLHGALSALA